MWCTKKLDIKIASKEIIYMLEKFKSNCIDANVSIDELIKTIEEVVRVDNRKEVNLFEFLSGITTAVNRFYNENRKTLLKKLPNHLERVYGINKKYAPGKEKRMACIKSCFTMHEEVRTKLTDPSVKSCFYEFLLMNYERLTEELKNLDQDIPRPTSSTSEKEAQKKIFSFFKRENPKKKQPKKTKNNKSFILWAKNEITMLLIDNFMAIKEFSKADKYIKIYEKELFVYKEKLENYKNKIRNYCISESEIKRLRGELENKELSYNGFNCLKEILSLPDKVKNIEQLITIAELWIKKGNNKKNVTNLLSKLFQKSDKDKQTDILLQFAKDFEQKVIKIYEIRARRASEVAFSLAMRKKKDDDPFFVKDMEEVREHLEFAASKGYKPAIHALAELVLNDLNSDNDLGFGKKYLLTISSEEKDVNTYYLLGEICFFQREFNDAKKYYQLANQEGHPYASQALQVLSKENQHVDNKENSNQDEIEAKAKEFHKQYIRKYGENARWYLITKLLYEAKRHHNWDYFICKVLRNALYLLDKAYKDKDSKFFEEKIVNYETKSGDYFGEDISNDSDEEDREHYHDASDKIKAHRENVDQVFKKINIKMLLKKVDEIIGADDKSINNKIKGVQDLFNAVYPNAMKLSNTLQTYDDLQIVNHYSARGELNKAIPIITTKFKVLQVRGNGFKLDNFNKTQRREYRAYLKTLQRDYRLSKIPQYSQTVYEKSGLFFGGERIEYNKYKLDKWARLLRFDLQKILQTKPSVETYKYFRKEFNSLNDLIQWNYSVDYGGHKELLKKPEIFSKELHNVLFNDKTFFVSTSDLFYHPLRYAYNVKFYTNQSGTTNGKDNRLRPRYKKIEQDQLRAERPHSGVVFVSLHPLEDYVGFSHNHVPSMNWHGRIEIIDNINNERETSFLVYIPNERVVYIHFAKYPTILCPNYQEIYKYKYGLPEELYKKFYQLFKDNPPHSQKRRAAQRILGEYLAAYANAYLYLKVKYLCDQRGEVLLFRDFLGNFSLIPNISVSSNPHGSELSKRLLRHYSQKRRQKRKRDKDAILDDETSSPSLVKKPRLSKNSLFANEPNGWKEFCNKLMNSFINWSNQLGSDQNKYVEMKTQAKMYGYVCKDVPKDGNCFFQAICDQLELLDSAKYKVFSYEKLKELAIDYILNNINDYKEIGSDINIFIEKILKKGEWADHPIIDALSKALGIGIVFVRSDGAEPTYLNYDDFKPFVVLGYLIDYHFQSLRRDPNIVNPQKNLLVPSSNMEIEKLNLNMDLQCATKAPIR